MVCIASQFYLGIDIHQNKALSLRDKLLARYRIHMESDFTTRAAFSTLSAQRSLALMRQRTSLPAFSEVALPAEDTLDEVDK